MSREVIEQQFRDTALIIGRGPPCTYRVQDLKINIYHEVTKEQTMTHSAGQTFKLVLRHRIQSQVQGAEWTKSHLSFFSKSDSRWLQFETKFGLMLLAVLSFSKSFEMASKEFSDLDWAFFFLWMDKDKKLLELYIKQRSTVPWEAFLSICRNEYPNHQDLIQLELKEEVDDEYDPTAHWYLDHGRRVRKKFFNAKAQVKIDNFVFNTDIWGSKPDPTRREALDTLTTCYLCGSTVNCNCLPSDLPEPIVQFRSYSNRGLGVETVDAIPARFVVGIYLGEILPPGHPTCGTYALDHGSSARGNRATIDSAVYGNWTRFANDSCEPNLMFDYVVLGNRRVMGLVSTREIESFEELTVDYGNDYWEDQLVECSCDGTKKRCLFNRQG